MRPASLLYKARLEKEVIFKPNLTYYLPVTVSVNDQGQLAATPVDIGGSGDFAGLLHADGFVELPQSQTVFKTGEVFPYIGFRK